MADTPFGPYSGRRSGAAGRHGDGQGSRARERGAQRSRTRTWERSFRCASARRRPIENSMARYIDFVRIHQEATAESAVAVRRIWWVGVAFAVIAAGLAYAIVLALRGLLDVPVPVFARSEVSTQAAALSYAVCAMAGSIQATALLHILAATAARPVRAFTWIGGIVVLLATLIPLTVPGAPPGAVLATAGLNLAGGTAMVAVLASVAAATLRGGTVRRGRR